MISLFLVIPLLILSLGLVEFSLLFGHQKKKVLSISFFLTSYAILCVLAFIGYLNSPSLYSLFLFLGSIALLLRDSSERAISYYAGEKQGLSLIPFSTSIIAGGFALLALINDFSQTENYLLCLILAIVIGLVIGIISIIVNRKEEESVPIKIGLGGQRILFGFIFVLAFSSGLYSGKLLPLGVGFFLIYLSLTIPKKNGFIETVVNPMLRYLGLLVMIFSTLTPAIIV